MTFSLISTSAVSSGNTVTQPTTTSNSTQAASGLSSVGNSLVSLESKSCCTGIFSFLFRPFIDAFNGIKEFFASIFSSAELSKKSVMEEDQERYAFIGDNLQDISGSAHQQCLDNFFHISNPLIKLQALKLIQGSDQVPAQTVGAFFAHLPVEQRDHIKRHIWEANGNADNGMGMQYGDYMIHWQVKHDYVKQAIEKCIKELQ